MKEDSDLMALGYKRRHLRGWSDMQWTSRRYLGIWLGELFLDRRAALLKDHINRVGQIQKSQATQYKWSEDWWMEIGMGRQGPHHEDISMPLKKSLDLASKVLKTADEFYNRGWGAQGHQMSHALWSQMSLPGSGMSFCSSIYMVTWARFCLQERTSILLSVCKGNALK